MQNKSINEITLFRYLFLTLTFSDATFVTC